MAVRKIVKIDEEKCNGCGLCIPACAEGAIELVGGKAKVVSDVYCDGLGACLGTCPQGAITIEEREAEPFDAQKAKEHVAKTKRAAPPAGRCPGAMARELQARATARAHAAPSPSALTNWPVQLHLVPPSAPYFQGADLLLVADCVPFACPDFHARFLAGRRLVVGCPKLDDVGAYRAKLAEISRRNDIRSVEVVRMEVPCCFGLVRLAQLALGDAGKPVPLAVTTIGIGGEIRQNAGQDAPMARESTGEGGDVGEAMPRSYGSGGAGWRLPRRQGV